jgi:hypothetical protein
VLINLVIEDEPVAESSKRAETFVDVAPSLRDLGKDKDKKEKVSLVPSSILWASLATDMIRKR